MSDKDLMVAASAAAFIERATATTPLTSPTPQRLEPVPLIQRQAFAPANPFGVTPTQWRTIVSRAPIVALCIRTMILQVTAIPWKIVADTPEVVDLYTDIVENANDESFDLFTERLLEDMLTMPFGGAVEPVRDGEDNLAMVYHVDGGSLYPTYDSNYPYVQIDPDNSMRRVYYQRDMLERIQWAPMPDLRNYEWSKPPVLEVFGAVEALMRSDVFYGQFLANTPEAGILDLMDMKKDDALQWVKSWQEMMVGIDPLKIPVLYQHTKEAKFIAFARTPSEITLPELVKRYAEIVCGAFGMNIGDLGLFEHTNTLAGASKMMGLSKRQGLGSVMRKLARTINRCLPKGVRFVWDPLDEEDRLRKAQSQKSRADTLKVFATPDITTGVPLFPLSLIRKQAVSDGLLDVISIDDFNPDEIEALIADERAAVQDQKIENMKVMQDALPAPAAPPPGAPPPPPQPGKPAIPPKPAPHQARAQTDETEYPEQAPYAMAFMRTVEAGLNAARRRITIRAVTEIVEALKPTLDNLRADTERALPPELEALIVAQLDSRALSRLELDQAQVVASFTKAYEAGLLSGAEDIQRALYVLKRAASPKVTGSFNLDNPLALEALQARGLDLVRNLNMGTRTFMLTAFAEAFTATGAGSTKALVKQIHSNLTDTERGAFGRARLESIVHHEMNFVHSAARLEQYREAGLTRKRWEAVDAVACDLCMDNQSKGAVPLDFSFRSVFGETQHPPGHPRVCHCHLGVDMDELRERAAGADDNDEEEVVD